MMTAAIVVALPFVLSGCRKNKKETSLADVDYYFTNNTGRHIQVKIFDEDAPDKASFVLSIDAKSKASIPYWRLTDETGKYRKLKYYAATDDYIQSGWGDSAWKSFSYTAGQQSMSISIDTLRPCPAMRYALNGIDGTTRWQMMDVADAGRNSILSTLTEHQAFREMEMKFDKTAVYRYYDSADKLQTVNIQLTIPASQSSAGIYSIETVSVQTEKVPLLAARNNWGLAGALFNTTSTDTIFQLDYKWGKFLTWVKQKN